MDAVERDVYRALDEMGIRYRAVTHPPVFTIEDCKVAEEMLGGIVPKNLFLTPRNKSALYLMLMRPDAAFRTSDISKQIGSSRLSFAGAEPLMRIMRTLPGAISPMGLLFDRERSVQLVVDRALLSEGALLFHPCVNTASIRMSGADFFEKYLPRVGYVPTFVDAGREDGA